MRLLLEIFLISLTALAVAEEESTLPRLVSIQILRCPVVTYHNLGREEVTSSRSIAPYNQIYHSEFDEILRFEPNETGNIQFFVTGQGNFTVRPIVSGRVLSGVRGTTHVDGAALLEYQFNVMQGVEEEYIDLVMISGDTKKITKVYISTKSLEPPRPPSQFESLIISEAEIEALEASEEEPSELVGFSSDSNAEVVTPEPEKTPSVQVSSDGDVDVSNATIEIVKFPTAADILTGDESSIQNQNLKLLAVEVRRGESRSVERYQSETNRYFVRFDRKEKGLLMFNVQGRGEITVTVKSVTIKKDIAKVMQVSNRYAAFPYTVTDKTISEGILVKVSNNYNDQLFFYLQTLKEF